MADLPTVTPDYFEILVVRELRKVGFEVGAVRIHRRAELPEPERGFVLELLALLSRPPWTRQVLVACRRQEAPVARDVVEMKRRQKTADRAAEEKCRIAVCGEIEHTAQRTAALGEWDVSRHREFGRRIWRRWSIATTPARSAAGSSRQARRR